MLAPGIRLQMSGLEPWSYPSDKTEGSSEAPYSHSCLSRIPEGWGRGRREREDQGLRLCVWKMRSEMGLLPLCVHVEREEE